MPITMYWPRATTKDGVELFTCDSVLTKERAIKQFDIWESSYNYQIKEAWINCSNGTRIKMEKRWTEVSEDARK